MEIIQSFDQSVLDWIQANLSCGFMDGFMPAVSALANAGIIFFAAAGIMLFFRNYRRCAVNILICMAVAAVVANLIMKPLIARDRPCWLNEEIQLLVAVPQDFSFPSGHTLHSFMVATVIFMYDRRIGIPSFVLAALIGFSRLYLYVHFPTDVLCGALLGVAFAVGGYYLLRFVLKKLPKLSRYLPEREA